MWCSLDSDNRIFGFHLRFSGSGPHFLAVWDKFVSVEGALATPDSENCGRRIPWAAGILPFLLVVTIPAQNTEEVSLKNPLKMIFKKSFPFKQTSPSTREEIQISTLRLKIDPYEQFKILASKLKHYLNNLFIY